MITRLAPVAIKNNRKTGGHHTPEKKNARDKNETSFDFCFVCWYGRTYCVFVSGDVTQVSFVSNDIPTSRFRETCCNTPFATTR